jgi:glycosyltransferase involved in cell wall biosynthesis
MISVVIPVLDVSATVSAVVKLALADPRVSEVVVVDDGSIDGAPELAEAAGARVITSTLLGKGASMRDVDIGLLLDAARLETRLVQVHIGHIEHDTQPLQVQAPLWPICSVLCLRRKCQIESRNQISWSGRNAIKL